LVHVHEHAADRRLELIQVCLLRGSLAVKVRTLNVGQSRFKTALVLAPKERLSNSSVRLDLWRANKMAESVIGEQPTPIPAETGTQESNVFHRPFLRSC
jgi:hypothetical protein